MGIAKNAPIQHSPPGGARSVVVVAAVIVVISAKEINFFVVLLRIAPVFIQLHSHPAVVPL